MDEKIRRALEHDQTIDITTQGRKTGSLRRIEIWYHNVNGRVYISGLPGKRDWYANLVANPEFTFHLKQSVQADLPAYATPITAEAQRREIMSHIVRSTGHSDELDKWVKDSPLVEVSLGEYTP
jgi:deazaflavin-dependent oxidoreductase (nitroreductase family)